MRCACSCRSTAVCLRAICSCFGGRFALLNAELTVKKVDYDYVHDARCSIQSYNRCSCWIC
jgi:hypothetical protein